MVRLNSKLNLRLLIAIKTITGAFIVLIKYDYIGESFTFDVSNSQLINIQLNLKKRKEQQTYISSDFASSTSSITYFTIQTYWAKSKKCNSIFDVKCKLNVICILCTKRI